MLKFRSFIVNNIILITTVSVMKEITAIRLFTDMFQAKFLDFNKKRFFT